MDPHIDRDELEEFGLLFVLEEPIVKLDNGQQANAILIVDTARHEAKAGLDYKQMSLMFRDGRPISDRQRMDPRDVEPARTATKRPLEYVLVTDKEMKAMESARNVRKKVDELLRDLVDVASTSTSGPPFPSQLQGLYPSHPTYITAAPVLCVDPGPRRSVVVVPQRGISAEEDQSLIDLCLTNASEILQSADYMYCIELRLAPREDNSLHSDLLGPGIPGRVYRACIDSSDSSFWIYQRGFVEGRGRDYLATNPDIKKTTLPPGPESALKERAQINYQDRSWCGLQRWNFEKVTTPLEVPLWKWSSNAQSKMSLDFPRILVEKANSKVLLQPYDGTFGLAVPGSRYPWKFNTGPEERTTVFDVLLNEGRPYVPSPFRMTLRLLWPLQNLGPRSQQVRSFLYFGHGNPCGIPGSGSKLLTPEFGPQIPIEEAAPSEVAKIGERHFRCWTVRLLSMTLLVPLILPPNYESSGAPFWEAKTISFPNMDGHGGMRAELDSASARTYVPISVYNDIRRSWFHQRNNVPGVSGWTSDTFLPDANPFQNHDIIFKFKGLDDDEVEFRCSAERFLVSPWFRPNEGFVVPFKAFCPTGDGDPEVATLGMNFFWSAIVRFDAEHRGIRPVPGIDQPYVQLAAQRILQDGRVVADAHDIEIHRDAPPRVQAAARKQPGLLR